MVLEPNWLDSCLNISFNVKFRNGMWSVVIAVAVVGCVVLNMHFINVSLDFSR